MRSNIKKVYILASLLILSSCGGGGGGGAVAQAIAAAISSFTSSSSSVLLGGTVDISWASTNATSCSAPWTTQTGTSGTETVTITTAGNNTFTISCTGEGGSSSQSQSIEGYRNIAGITLDGYISGANIFIDTDSDYIMDSGETSTT
mgnify:FL=1